MVTIAPAAPRAAGCIERRAVLCDVFHRGARALQWIQSTKSGIEILIRPPSPSDDVRALQTIVDGEGLPRVLARRAIRAWQGVAGVSGAVNDLAVLEQVPPQLVTVIRRGQWNAMATVLEKLAATLRSGGELDEAAQKGFELVRMAAEDSRSSAAIVRSHYARVSEARREVVAKATGRPIPTVRDTDGKHLTNAPDSRSGLAGLAQPKGKTRG